MVGILYVCIDLNLFQNITFLGRLADILGRKGAMLLALSLFGKIEQISKNLQHTQTLLTLRVWYNPLWNGSINEGSYRGSDNCRNGRRRVSYSLIDPDSCWSILVDARLTARTTSSRVMTGKYRMEIQMAMGLTFILPVSSIAVTDLIPL